jgi:hypothetical protein
MRRLRYLWLVVVLVGCGEGPPPLDELPLRDALRADPEVVAALPDDARAKLASRLEAARAGDGVTDDLHTDAVEPVALVAALDVARARRSGGPLVAGVIAGGVATPLADSADDAGGPALPALESGAAAATGDLELAALNEKAGASLRALLRASGASRLRRVTGWPTGAVAIGDSVYVNAAWLVAMAPANGGPADAGAPPATTGGPAPAPATGAQPPARAPSVPPSGADAGAPAEEQSALASAVPSDYGGPDGGTTTTAPTPTPTDTSFWDSCAACSDACASSDSSGCDDSSDNSCDSTSSDDGSTDSCNNTTDDGSTDSCNNTGDGGDSNCQVAGGRSRGHGRGGGPGRVAWLLTPLGYLMARERAGKVRRLP